MRVVFLDIDGVLNCHSYLAGLAARVGAYDRNDHEMIDSVAVERLNRIVERAGAKVVVSSSWRWAHTLQVIARMLALRGFRGEAVGATPHQGKMPSGLWAGEVRGHEIQAWLDAHPAVERFTILDDSTDMAHLAPYLVRTYFETGLQDEHVEQAVAMLLG